MTGLFDKSKWKSTCLGDAVEFLDSKRIPLSSLERGRMRGDYPYYGAAGIVDYVNDYIFDGAHILLGEDGTVQTSSGTAVVQWVTGKFWVNNHAHVLVARRGQDLRFLYYLLLALDVTSLVTGAVQPKISQGRLSKAEILLPPLEEQKRIAEILSAFDDKIELNRKMNATLESLAMAYFNEMIRESDSWKKGILGDIVDIVMGQSPSGSSYNEEGIGEYFYQGCTDFGIYFPKVRQFTTEPKRMAKRNDILFSVRAPVGTINIAERTCCIGRGLAALSPKYPLCYVWCLLKSLKADFDVFNGEGTVFGSVNKDTLQRIEISLPPKEIIIQFDKLTVSMMGQILVNEEEIRFLTQQRGSLLPKLIFGEIDVSEVGV